MEVVARGEIAAAGVFGTLVAFGVSLTVAVRDRGRAEVDAEADEEVTGKNLVRSVRLLKELMMTGRRMSIWEPRSLENLGGC